MSEQEEAPAGREFEPTGDTGSVTEARTSAADDDLAGAIAVLSEEAPLVLFDGIVVTDGGHVIQSQYVDIGVEKLTRRPSVLVKANQAQYGIEHAANVQLSAPWRFRDFGETLIRDDQEGYAHRETGTETAPRPPEESHREQERALRLLGEEGVTISGTGRKTRSSDTESRTFGKSSWIYCTSVAPGEEQRGAWRSSLPLEYDHESMIRQPRRFALALGEMFADQHGPRGNRNDLKHGTVIRSFHEGQFIFHGPVWYTEDVLEFLRARESDPLYLLHALFVKHTDYREQREYRFVVHCERPVESETLLLGISGNLRGALAPRGKVGPVSFEPMEVVETAASSKPEITQTPGTRTATRTRRETDTHTWTARIGGEIAEESVATREKVIAVTTELPADGLPETGEGGGLSRPGRGVAIVSEERERKVAGEVVDSQRSLRTKVFYLDDASEADPLFTLEERDDAAAMLETAQRPFEGFAGLSRSTIEAIKTLVREAMELDRDVEVQAMSACWNAIWAVCNIHECYGDIVESVGIEGGEFVAIMLNGSTRAGAEAKILVGPRGTFAYVLTLGDARGRGHGGTEGRLVYFPDEETRAKFEEFGWTPRSEEQEAV